MQKGAGGLIIIIALLTVVGVGRCQSSGSDADVIRILKSSINAPMSFQWTDPDVCKWRRIQCDSAKRVTAIQIGNQNLQGTLPKELEKLSALQNLECQGNSLTGSFPYLPKSVQKLIIHDNKFNSIPNDIFKGLGSLQEVNMDDIPFPPWQIPQSLADCVALRTFTAQRVGFVGTIPDLFGKNGHFPGLIFLGLSGNSLEGPLPPSLATSSIETVLVNGNSRLNGTISVLKTMTSLKQFWAHGNAFTGPIPDMSNHNHLYDINLRDNQLTGVIPLSLTTLPSLKVVNLTNNLFQGSPPKFKDGVGVDNYLDKGRNQYCTPIPGEPCSSVVNALLSAIEPLGYPLIFAKTWWGNDPCGNKWLGIICSGGNISVVNFQGMGLSGAISPSFATLTSVTKLVLSNNNLTSKIPTELTTMPHLQELDVSNNNLYGNVPKFRDGVVLKLDGNPDIGKDRPSSSSSSDSEDDENNNNNDNNNNKNNTTNYVIVGVLLGIFILLVPGILIYMFLCRKKPKHARKFQHPTAIVIHPNHSGDRNAMLKIASAGVHGGGAEVFSPSNNAYQVESSGNLLISIDVLKAVTNNFAEENVLGKGGFGTVYKGKLHDGTRIAVKRMQSGIVAEKGVDEFMAETAVVTIRHRNLVNLMGYCLDENERLLVYEYMPQGTLSRHLFHWENEGLKPLEWKTRLIIALDVARGVEYLHGLAQQTFIHRDLKPSNILLGDDMRAKVADFGLVRLAPQGKASFQTRLAGTFGYLAPEYAATGRLTTKVDVYSFGVILMELITGRKALDESRPEENFHLVSWFRRMLLDKDSFRTIIDSTIEADEETLSSINTVAELAGHCCAREPHQRPDMSHVVNVLSPLIEVWKPTEPDVDEIYGINFNMTLPEALQRWKQFEGNSTLDFSSNSSPPHSGIAPSYRSSDGRPS
ncbi:hypothetical protein HN51_024833 [Arachis hypogaea]|uniref:non-specific serine/threonine protein kinase n=1 Tax=Arachis hypogaea TaxID=3818 RepID=A0A445C6T1_ARAHY|nr:receptor protein kinase TMK1-like [Arachis hypogaea]QHO27905.1 Receptor protein kinase [Arachis hypogaea]RYR46666.1 hypothetical protein Ahy_A07g032433 [Arachis hypogaea]